MNTIVLWICYKKIEVCCYLRNTFLFNVYECISGLQPSFQCGVNMLAYFSIILQSVLTKGKDTTDPTPQLESGISWGWCLFESDGAITKPLWWSVLFPSMFLCDRKQGINMAILDTGISIVDQAHSITLFFHFLLLWFSIPFADFLYKCYSSKSVYFLKLWNCNTMFARNKRKAL